MDLMNLLTNGLLSHRNGTFWCVLGVVTSLGEILLCVAYNVIFAAFFIAWKNSITATKINRRRRFHRKVVWEIETLESDTLSELLPFATTNLRRVSFDREIIYKESLNRKGVNLINPIRRRSAPACLSGSKRAKYFGVQTSSRTPQMDIFTGYMASLRTMDKEEIIVTPVPAPEEPYEESTGSLVVTDHEFIMDNEALQQSPVNARRLSKWRCFKGRISKLLLCCSRPRTE